MNKFILIVLLSTIYCNAQKEKDPIMKKAIFLPVRVSFEDTIYVNNMYRKSFKDFSNEAKLDSIQYPFVVNFEGKFKNNKISVYNMGERDIFDVTEPKFEKMISFDNATTGRISGTTGFSFVINKNRVKDSFLVQLNDGNTIIIKVSKKYHFINLFFNREKRYWYVDYSNYMSVGY